MQNLVDMAMCTEYGWAKITFKLGETVYNSQ